jgi:Uri superfamily endonuclease
MNEKEEWIIDYLKNKTAFKFIDMLDEDFVEAYIDEFEVKSQNMTLGASKCKELSKLLGSMYKKGLLNRFPHGVRSGYNQDYANFKAPKWVYSYELIN